MDTVFQGQKLFSVRLTIGLAQGLALYLLYSAYDAKTWPAMQGMFFVPLLLDWVFIPTLLISALGELPLREALLWAGIALLFTTGVSLFDNWSAWPQDWVYAENAMRAHIIPSPQLIFFWGAALFVAHALVLGGYADRRFMATYPTHFDTAWKLALQLALAGVFVGAFWVLLWLGAGLFDLIKLGFFEQLIRHLWFAIPITALAGAGALHLTDIRPALVRGARTLLLTLLSWLLPLITLIVAGFVVSLTFTGLQPLWSIGHASALLLAATAALLILINATHQDGEPERLPPRLLRLAGTVAAVLTVPLALIATFALYLRIAQHGWSVDRVMMAASMTTALGYAGGYAWAAVRPGPWLDTIKTWNFGMALFVLAIVIALFTPLASPARIAVADQMARLDSGKIAPEKFDYHFLRWDGGRYGMRALQRLAASKGGFAAKRAQDALLEKSRYNGIALTNRLLPDRMTVYPAGAKLPDTFIQTDWSRQDRIWIGPNCPTGASCDAILADLDGDGRSEILILNPQFSSLQVFRENAQSVWSLAGTIALPPQCPRLMDALRQGHFQIESPSSRLNDMVAAGVRLHPREPEYTEVQPACPPG